MAIRRSEKKGGLIGVHMVYSEIEKTMGLHIQDNPSIANAQL